MLGADKVSVFFSFSVKPKSPSVRSAVFQPQSNQAVITIKTPYHRDYLTASNQIFQFHLWSAAGRELVKCDFDFHVILAVVEMIIVCFRVLFQLLHVVH